ncbi:MAG: cytidylate kinase-like family protein [Deltaproteobacteria bacterium]|nr:cytidylate kinase-like family protein [Deltaproteobacteria bacterium]
MSIVTISRGSHCYGTEIAEKVARKLGFECISREILLDASRDYHVPEVKLIKAIHDSPSFLDRLTLGKKRYITYIQTELLKHLNRDNIVYHGLAGHFFVRDISHVLKVRVIADHEDRIKLVMGRDHVSEKEAVKLLERDDAERKKWGLALYNIDTTDPSLYDLVLRIRKFSVDDAVDIICRSVQLKQFQTTADSKQKLADILLASRVRSILIDIAAIRDISAAEGVVYVSLEGHALQLDELHTLIRKKIFDEVGFSEVKFESIITGGLAD